MRPCAHPNRGHGRDGCGIASPHSRRCAGGRRRFRCGCGRCGRRARQPCRRRTSGPRCQIAERVPLPGRQVHGHGPQAALAVLERVRARGPAVEVPHDAHRACGNVRGQGEGHRDGILAKLAFEHGAGSLFSVGRATGHHRHPRGTERQRGTSSTPPPGRPPDPPHGPVHAPCARRASADPLASPGAAGRRGPMRGTATCVGG